MGFFIETGYCWCSLVWHFPLSVGITARITKNNKNSNLYLLLFFFSTAAQLSIYNVNRIDAEAKQLPSCEGVA